MKENNLKVVNLYNYKKYIPQVANWIYKEFIENKINDCEYVDIENSLNNRLKDEIPFTYIGLIEDKCIGTISVFENDLKKCKDLTPWLAALYVDESCRGNGYAKGLIESVLDKIKELGHKKIYLRTETAGNYYLELGWEEVLNIRDEHGIDTTVFTKHIVEDSKPDRFGSFSEIMNCIHSDLIIQIVKEKSLTLQSVELPIHQMSIYEYIDAKHDENYKYYFYDVSFNKLRNNISNSNPGLIISVNNSFAEDYNKDVIKSLVVNNLMEKWSEVDKVNICLVKETDTIDKNDNDVIQTVHFFYEGEQIFKIIYFFNTWNQLLELSMGHRSVR